MLRRILVVAGSGAIALVSGCGALGIGAPPEPAAAPTYVPSFPPSWTLRSGARAPFAPREMVVSNAPLASRAGLELLAAGGNAVDAAVATGFALAVVYPEAGNIGGGGYAVIRMASGETAAIDYREVAPRGATRGMFIDPATGNTTQASLFGHLASGVPGSVAGLLATLDRFGTKPRADVIAPALRLAREGFVVDSAFARALRADSALICRFAGCTLFVAGGRMLGEGDTLRQPELARTLERIAAEGATGFYHGPVARAIANEMSRGGGLITEDDLASYRPAWRAPVAGRYRNHTILAMPPSSSGGVTLVEALNILEAFGPAAPYGSVTSLHRMLGAFQLAFVDRNEYLADPDAVPVPVDRLIDPAYARAQRARLDDRRYVSTQTLSPGLRRREGGNTTHYSVVDRFGNAIASTTTINSLFGSGVWVPGGGFFLNNEMDDFTAQPGKPNQYNLIQGDANAIAPGKRMLSAMSPTIVVGPDNRVLLVLGSRGGPRIITGVAQVIQNVIDHRMSLADAMAAPRAHFQGFPEAIRFETGGVSRAVLDSLVAMGWRADTGTVGSPVAIHRVRGGWEGTWDPRAAGGAAGR